MTNYQILQKYPYLHDPGVYSYATRPDETWVDDVPVGWRPRFFALCDFINETLEKHHLPLDKFKVIQVKEKFGALRMYWATEPEVPKQAYQTIHDAIDRCEVETARMCWQCGEPAQWHSRGWILPYCEKHAKEWCDDKNRRYPDMEPTTLEKSFTPINPLT